MTSPSPEDLRRFREVDEPQDRPAPAPTPEPTREDFSRIERDVTRRESSRDNDRDRQRGRTPTETDERGPTKLAPGLASPPRDEPTPPTVREAEQAQAIKDQLESRGFAVTDEQAAAIVTDINDPNKTTIPVGDIAGDVAFVIRSLIPIVGTTEAAIQTARNFEDASNLKRTADITLTTVSAIGDIVFVLKGAKAVAAIRAVKAGRNVDVFMDTQVFSADDAVLQTIRQPDAQRTITVISDSDDVLRQADEYVDFLSNTEGIDKRLKIVAENPSTNAVQAATQIAQRANNSGLRPQLVLNLEQDLPVAQFRTIQQTFTDAGVRSIDINVVTRQNPGEAVDKAVDRWVTFRSNFGNRPNAQEIAEARARFAREFAGQDPQAVKGSAKKLETFLERQGIDTKVIDQEITAFDVTDRTRFIEGIDLAPGGQPPSFSRIVEDALPSGLPGSGGGRTVTQETVQLADAVIVTGRRTNPVAIGIGAPLVPAVVTPTTPTQPTDAPAPFVEPGIFPTEFPTRAPAFDPFQPAGPTVQPPLPPPAVTTFGTPQPVPPTPGDPFPVPDDPPGATPDRPTPEDEIIITPTDEPGDPFGGTFTPEAPVDQPTPIDTPTEEPIFDPEDTPARDPGPFPEGADITITEPGAAVVAVDAPPPRGVGGSPPPRGVFAPPPPRRPRPDIDLPATPEATQAEQFAGLPTVAWKQGGQWVAVTPPYEIGNFSFPTSTPVGSRFFRTAGDAFTFVESTGVALSIEAREHWAILISLSTPQSVEIFRDQTREKAAMDAEISESEDVVNTEAQGIDAENEINSMESQNDAMRIRAEHQPVLEEKAKFEAQMDAELRDMGITPGGQRSGIFRLRNPGFTFGRIPPRPVTPSATEVDV